MFAFVLKRKKKLGEKNKSFFVTFLLVLSRVCFFAVVVVVSLSSLVFNCLLMVNFKGDFPANRVQRYRDWFVNKQSLFT